MPFSDEYLALHSEEPVLFTPVNVDSVRSDFPELARTVYDRPLVFLDNAASSLKPKAVIDRISAYYTNEHANIHRGVHYLSQQATEDYENARRSVQSFINAPSTSEIIFTRGTTEAINLIAATYGRTHLQPGDEVLISTMEHHSNIVPWQMICEERGAHLRVIPINDAGELIYDEFQLMLNERTKMVAVGHVSNTLGTINPIKRMIADAHGLGIPVLVDGAQAAPHMAIDVQDLDCDFYCISGHKMFGPTGIGILYGKAEWLDKLPPYQGGGDMIESVSFEQTTWNELPHKFEAGTPNIAGGIGLGATVEYLNTVGMDAINYYEYELLTYATEKLSETPGVQLVGTAADKASVLSFLIKGVHPYDAGTILDRLGIAVRTGHHCTQPLMRRFGIPGTVRASLAFYNTKAEIDALVEGIGRVKQMFA